MKVKKSSHLSLCNQLEFERLHVGHNPHLDLYKTCYINNKHKHVTNDNNTFSRFKNERTQNYRTTTVKTEIVKV